MVKKILVFALVLAMLIQIVGCTNTAPATTTQNESTETSTAASVETTESSPVTLKLATFLYVETPHRKAIDRLVEAYNEIDPNVQIEVSGAGYADYWNNLTSEILANNETDIVQIYPENIASYYTLRDGGAFVDLTDLFAASGLDGQLIGQEFASYDGKTLALSNYSWGTTAIFYRKSMLEAKGVNPDDIKTQDDFLEVCKLFSDGTHFATGVVYGSHSFSVSEWNRLIARPVSNGLYFKNGEAAPYTAENLNCNSEENIWAAQWWNDFIATYKCGKLVLDKKDSREMFWNGEAPFNMDGPWFIGMSEEYGEELMNDIGIIPQFDIVYNGVNYKPNPTNYPVLSCISSNSKHAQEAWDFLVWMTSDEAQRIIADCGQIPASIEYSSSDEYKQAYPLSAKFADFIQNEYATLVADPAIPEYAELNQVMIDAAAEMFSEEAVDVRPILNDAYARMAEILG